MLKTYVLDTNVLIQAPHALRSFEDNNVVLPVAVLEELDRLKNEDGERGANARQVIRYLESLRETGNLLEGVTLPEGGTLRLETNHSDIKLPDSWRDNTSDNRILKVCRGIAENGQKTVLVTKDIVARIKAQIIGIQAEDFTTDQVASIREQYTGRTHAYIPDHLFETFKSTGVPLEDCYKINETHERQEIPPIPNQFFILHSDLSEKKTVLGKLLGERVVPLEFTHTQPFGVITRNVGQRFMQEALMLDAEQAPLVIIKGTAGTAKTFFALAAGLEQIMEYADPKYRKILICRPNVQFDEDIGYLPGTEQEKIAPMLRPIIDNLEILVDRNEKERYRNERELKGKIDELFDRGFITAEAMNFIRGRSITKTYLVIDEAQNLTPKQVKGVITRVGKGTKVVLLGDPQQIDHPLLDERTNGLSYAAEKMKGSTRCFQITMQHDECERSDLALEAAARM
ncbi:PhoH family protein [Synergistaceae bacterium OttesenSCG-928-D05]|nr:PhoH family protein [Synergistaceae bacterium OttesenSCG-928-D05]